MDGESRNSLKLKIVALSFCFAIFASACGGGGEEEFEPSTRLQEPVRMQVKYADENSPRVVTAGDDIAATLAELLADEDVEYVKVD